MKTLIAALMLATLAAPALPVQAQVLPGLHALTAAQTATVERRAKRCPKGETPTTNPACLGHGGGGI